jgi:hypothetical protein
VEFTPGARLKRSSAATQRSPVYSSFTAPCQSLRDDGAVKCTGPTFASTRQAVAQQLGDADQSPECVRTRFIGGVGQGIRIAVRLVRLPGQSRVPASPLIPLAREPNRPRRVAEVRGGGVAETLPFLPQVRADHRAGVQVVQPASRQGEQRA